jgi:predicted transposase YdaD
MEKLYDPTLKALVETAPADWLALLRLPPAPVSVIDADIAAVLAGAADKVLRAQADPAYLLHLDFQAGHDSARLPRRLRPYNTVLEDRHDLLVRSVAVLLQPGADSPQLSGTLERAFPGEAPYSVFRYAVVRVWQLPVQQLLDGGLGTLPLAPISDVAAADVPAVIRQMERRLERRSERARAAEVWAATHILLGLRYSAEVAAVLLRGVLAMKESSTYQAIVAEGALQEARKLLMLVGQERWGTPDEATAAAINAITDVQPLEELTRRTQHVRSWQELLGRPAPRRRNGRRKTTP